MRRAQTICAFLLFAWTSHANLLDWGPLGFDPFDGMDECAKAVISRLVFDQRLPLSHADFHQMENTFEKLGIRFERTEHEDIPLEIDGFLVSHKVLSIHRVFRGHVVTEYISVETRIGAPQILAERVNERAFWHSDENGFYGVLSGARKKHGQTRGAAELQRIWGSNALDRALHWLKKLQSWKRKV
jgi:hypothetical protein